MSFKAFLIMLSLNFSDKFKWVIECYKRRWRALSRTELCLACNWVGWVYMWEVSAVAPLLHRVWLQMTSPTEENLTFIPGVLASFLYSGWKGRYVDKKFFMSVFAANFDSWPTIDKIMSRKIWSFLSPLNPDVGNPWKKESEHSHVSLS